MQGLGNHVTLNGLDLQNWTMWKLGTLDGTRLTKFAHTVLSNSVVEAQSYPIPGGPGLYVGNFSISNRTIYDTFVKLDGWTKVYFE